MKKQTKEIITIIGIIMATGFIFYTAGYIEGIERNREDLREFQITLSECVLSHANCNRDYVNCVADKINLERGLEE